MPGVKTYTTKEIADRTGIHVNTVRLYEKLGLITKPERKPNGYRIYSELHLEQCRLIRVAMRAEVLQNGLRKKAIETVKACAALDFSQALLLCGQYLEMTENEIRCAKAAVKTVESILQNSIENKTVSLKRSEAAEALKVTSETLRTWERNGLLEVGRYGNGYRVYNSSDMERLNIIRTLRGAGYSLSSILRLLNGLDGKPSSSVEALLNTPEEDDIVSVCDRLIESLNSVKTDILLLCTMIEGLKEKAVSLRA